MFNFRDSKEKLTPKKAVSVVAKTTKMMFKANPLGSTLIIVSNAIESVVPSFVAVFTGFALTAAASGDWQGFLNNILTILVLSVIRTILSHISGYFSWLMQYDIQYYAMELLYNKVAKIPIAVRELKENSDKLEIAENYATSLGWLFPRIVQVVSQIVAFVTAFVILTSVSWVIAVICLVLAAPNIIMTTYRMRYERKSWKENSVERRRGWGYRYQITDKKLAIELKLNGLNQFFIKQWRRFMGKHRDNVMKLDKNFLPYETSVGVIDNIAQIGVLIWSGKMVIDGFLEVGYLLTIKTLMDNLNSAASSLTFSINQVGLEIMNASDFFGYLDLSEEKPGEVVLENLNRPPKLEFRNVVFTYPMNEEPTIKGISFIVEPGEDIALVGENGSGKTTIIKLLLGVYQPDSGQILINDIPLEKLNKDAYYKYIGALFQDYARYNFTDLGDNIWFGDVTKKKSKSAMTEAVEKAKLGRMMAKFPNGFKQILSKEYDEDNGTDLSGGQWQRVALARGFFRNAAVLILDEPTAAVDAKAEYEIFQEIAKNQHGKTTIIISHRFSTVRKAQKILVIDGGKVIENGTHQELIKMENGLYREMFTLQAEGYLD